MDPDVRVRHVRDEQGTDWTVYQVERQARPTGKRAADVLPQSFADGWLVFQSSAEKRRLAPVPRNWMDLPHATLRSFLAVARPARPSGSVESKDVEKALRDEERS